MAPLCAVSRADWPGSRLVKSCGSERIGSRRVHRTDPDPESDPHLESDPDLDLDPVSESDPDPESDPDLGPASDVTLSLERLPLEGGLS